MSDGRPAPLQWRPMLPADLAAVEAMSIRIHPDFPERRAVLAEKLRLFPRGCFVLDGTSTQPCGYCFSHPWVFGPAPALDTLLQALPDEPAAYFIHDLAVDVSIRGRNLASGLIAQLVETARGLAVERMMLVAVSGSEPFWTRMGFWRTRSEALQAAARAKYGAGALQMERALA